MYVMGSFPIPPPRCEACGTTPGAGRPRGMSATSRRSGAHVRSADSHRLGSQPDCCAHRSLGPKLLLVPPQDSQALNAIASARDMLLGEANPTNKIWGFEVECLV